MKKALIVALIVIPCVLLFTACGNISLFGMKVKTVEIVSNPTKVVYVVGDKFEEKGMKIKVQFDDEELTIKTLAAKAKWVSGTALDKDGKFILAGEQTLILTYEGEPVTFTVTVNPAPVDPAA